MVKIKLELEKIMLIIFFAAMLYLGPGILFGHSISHDFPFAYGASDAFQHYTRAEAIKDIGNRYEASYIVKGNEDFVVIYPPLMYQLAVMISYASGLEIYDAIYFVIVFLAAISTLIMYFVIANFNKAVAILSLPFSLLIFSFPASTGFLWGHWPSVLAQLFLILVFWTASRVELKNSFILMSIAFSATVFSHTSSTVFAFIFLAVFFTLKLILKKLTKEEFKAALFAAIAFILISFYYLVIFLNTWARRQAYVFSVQPIWEGNPGFYIAGFGLLLVPIAFGIIFSLTRIRALDVAVVSSIVMLIGSHLNYIGFEVRSFQMRFFWPIYFSFFAGFGIYILLKFILKKWNYAYSTVAFIILMLLFSGIVKFPIITQTDVQAIPYILQLNRGTSQGLMNPFHWEALVWLRDNTPQNSNLYFFYGDLYGQDAILRIAKRVHQQVDPENFVNALQERKIEREYISEWPGDTSGSFVQRLSFFRFKDAEVAPGAHFGPRDICTFDYLVFDKVSSQHVLAQYNLLIASELLQKDYISSVFENGAVVILKNNNLGADCIEERNF